MEQTETSSSANSSLDQPAAASPKLSLASVKKALKPYKSSAPVEVLEQLAASILADKQKDAIVFELLGHLALAKKPDERLAGLARLLEPVASTWPVSSTPKPKAEEEVDSWVFDQLSENNDHPEPNRLRAVILWLLNSYQSPRIFLRGCLAVRQMLDKAATNSQAAEGFPMLLVANQLYSATLGESPKAGKNRDVVKAVFAVYVYLSAESEAAKKALSEKEGLELSLAQKNVAIQNLESGTLALQHEVDALKKELATLKTQVQLAQNNLEEAVAHSQSHASQSKREGIAGLRSKLNPRLANMRLYLDRPVPAKDQLMRLISEVEETLKEEGK